jgi:hypothetical protein
LHPEYIHGIMIRDWEVSNATRSNDKMAAVSPQ